MTKLRPHGRIKPRAGAAPTAEERRHLDRVGAMPCLVCGWEANIHHVTSDGHQRLTRTHRLVTPLCRLHHQDGARAVHVLGHAGFTIAHGIDLLAVARQLWDERDV